MAHWSWFSWVASSLTILPCCKQWRWSSILNSRNYESNMNTIWWKSSACEPKHVFFFLMYMPFVINHKSFEKNKTNHNCKLTISIFKNQTNVWGMLIHLYSKVHCFLFDFFCFKNYFQTCLNKMFNK